jgi:sulfur carrier protein
VSVPRVPTLIRVNGVERRTAAETLGCLLEELGYAAAAPGIAVAQNGEVVPRAGWSRRELRAGDDIEVVGAVQGG